MTNAPARPIAHFLGDLHLAPAQRSKSLTLWPLVLNDAFAVPDGPEYVALRNALAHEKLRVDEIPAPGGAAHLRVRNDGRVATLCLSGEKIRGTTRHHVAETSFLVPAAGAALLDSPSAEADDRARADADCERDAVDALLEQFHPIARQVGFVACIGDAVTGLEAIGRPEVFRFDSAAMIRPYAIEAIATERSPGRRSRKGRATSTGFDAPESFLRALADALVSSEPSLGIGNDYRIGGDLVAGHALANTGLVHLTAFPAAG
jgi:hypothetical protein